MRYKMSTATAVVGTGGGGGQLCSLFLYRISHINVKKPIKNVYNVRSMRSL